MTSLAYRIKQKAAELGFVRTGIVAAEPLAAEEENLRKWLSRGFNGIMAWMEREPEKRGDSRLLMPGARSVIVTALNYYTDHEHASDPARGKISRYAWGEDYHEVVRETLSELLAWLKEEVPSAETKICVDTAPLMDKAWAVRAGIGWPITIQRRSMTTAEPVRLASTPARRRRSSSRISSIRESASHTLPSNFAMKHCPAKSQKISMAGCTDVTFVRTCALGTVLKSKQTMCDLNLGTPKLRSISTKSF